MFGARQILIQHVSSHSPADGIERSREEAQEIAEALWDRLAAGEDFAEVARNHSDGPNAGDGGELEPFARGDLVSEFEEAVLALNPGEHSPVIESPYGFHIAQRLF